MQEKERTMLAVLRFAGRVVRQVTLQLTVLRTGFQLLKVRTSRIHRKTQVIGVTLVSPMIGLSGPSGQSTP